MTRLSKDAQAILDRTLDVEGPPSDASARVRAALAKRLTIASVSPPSPSVRTTVTTTSTLGLKIAGIVTVLGATYWAAHALGPSPKPVREIASIPIEQAPHDVHVDVPQVVSASPVATELPIASASPPPKKMPVVDAVVVAPVAIDEPSAKPTSMHVNTLGDELLLLHRANASMHENDPSSALRFIADYRARFPNGQLEGESMVVEVLALCESGRVEDAKVAANRALPILGQSHEAARIRESCAFRSPGDLR